MEIRQLEYLVLLAQERSFTRAAQRGNVAQPALSRQIAKLEAELGLPLVDRTTRRVAMTPAGLEMVEHARRVLAELDAARALAARSAAVLTGRVLLGVTTTPGSIDVPALLAAFHAAHPDVDLIVREDLSTRLADALRADALDLAFVTGVGAAARERLTLAPLATDPLRLVVAEGHRLAGRATVRVADLRDERFVAFPPGATIRETVARAAERAGFSPRVSFESAEIARTRAIVAHGLAVAVLPRSDAEAPGPPVVALPFRDAGMDHELFVAFRAARRMSPAAMAFRALLEE
jgi:LysR family transcriptional regulator, transcription activator of glutamate synthase operon